MKKSILALLTFFLFSSPVTAATTHYNVTVPTVGGSLNTWGTTINNALGAFDTYIWNAAGGTTVGVNAPASSSSNITLTNPINNTQNISFSAPGKKLILAAMNATASVVPGGVFYITNVGSNAFDIDANDGTTAIVTALAAGQTVALQLTSGATANGSFNIYGPYLTNVGILSLGTSVSIASPSISSDTTSGFYTSGAAKVDVAISGTKVTEWGTSGLNLPLQTASQILQTDASKNVISSNTLPNGTTATTQSAADSSTKVATTAFVNGTALTLASGTTATTQSPGDNSTKVATTAFVNGTALTLASGTTAVTQTSTDNSTKVATTAFVQGSGGLRLLATVNASGASSVTFNNTYITSSYNKYVLKFDSVYTSDSGILVLTFSTDNGSTYLGSGYKWAAANIGSTNSASPGDDSSINLGGGSGGSYLNNTTSSTSTITSQGSLEFDGLARAVNTTVLWTAAFPIGISSENGLTGVGRNTGTTAVNAIKITDSNGGTVTGNFHLYALQGN